ncbi:hypothetical protein E2C01_089846 [Portunus trituberculatus]|uniref:Uncharacterized protein n=1 Tax=Portunus trituberculatus TaxID=210409 RepID=A0A5B7JNJ4_PORTR|nr:hypothetical protein [Portunus trituberculatus]
MLEGYGRTDCGMKLRKNGLECLEEEEEEKGGRWYDISDAGMMGGCWKGMEVGLWYGTKEQCTGMFGTGAGRGGEGERREMLWYS